MNLFNNRIPSTQKNVNSNTITNYPTQTKQNNAKKIEKNKKEDSSNKSSFSTSKNGKDKSLWEDFMDYLDKKDPSKVKTFKKDVSKKTETKIKEKSINNIVNDEGIKKEVATTRVQFSEESTSFADTVDNVSATNNIIHQKEANMQEKLILEENEHKNIIDEKIKEYISNDIKDFSTNIDINTNVVKKGDIAPIDYKKQSERSLYKKARYLFSEIKKTVFKNNNQKIYVTNADIKESIDKTLKNKEQKQLMEENLAVFSQLDKIIENAEKINSSEIDNKKREQYSNYEYYVTKARINGKPYVVEFDTRLQRGVSGNLERHFRLERVYKINEVDTVTGTDKSINRFVPVSTSNNNIIHPKQANIQDIKNKKQIAPTREDVKKNEIRKKFEELTHIRILDKRSKKRNFRDIKSNLSNTWDMIVQKTVNSNHYIDKLAKESKNMELKYKADVTLSSSGIGQYNIGVAQTDLKGNKIGLSLQDIFKEIEENNQSQDFSRYMNLRHNTDREAVYRPIFGEDISSQTSNKLAKEYEALYPEFKKYAQSIYDYNNNELNLLVEAGMIDKNLADYMKELYPNYVPVERTIENNKVVSNKELSSGKGIKRATGGNSDILTLKEAQASKTMKIRRAIAYNQLIKELAGTLKNSEVTKGELGIDSSLDVNTLFDESNAPVKLDKDGKYKATYFENGESYTFEINKGLYESLKSRQSNFEIDWNNSIPGKMLQKATKFRKDFLTKYNLTFSTMNFIKDIQDAPLNSKYTKDFPKNYAKALKEIASNGKIYNLYMANGGGMNSYFNYENGVDSAVKTKNPIKIAGEKISMANEVIEQAPRLAEFISTIESGGSIAEAMYNSAEITTNFKRGGSIIKALDKNGVPFLNASVQGFDKFYRNFSEQSGAKNFCKMLTKAIMLGAVPSLFNWLLNKDDEDYKDLSESQKDLYYLFKYDNGKFIRIPKGRALSVFGSAVIRMGEKINGNENSFKGLGETISNQVAPNNPIDNNIIAPIVQAKTNKTWYGTDLVSDRLQKQLPKNQYDENTDLLSIFLGEKLNASPKKINYLIDQYSGGIGDIFLPMMTKSASNKGNVFKDKFTVDSVLNNKYVSEFYNTINKQTQIANDLEATEQDNLGLKYLTSIQNEISELYNEKRKIQNSDIKNKEKQEKVREIQEEINTKIKNSLKSYKNVENVDKERNDITKIGETYYIKSDRRVANTI